MDIPCAISHCSSLWNDGIDLLSCSSGMLGSRCQTRSSFDWPGMESSCQGTSLVRSGIAAPSDICWAAGARQGAHLTGRAMAPLE